MQKPLIRPFYVFGNWKQNPETLAKAAKFVIDFKKIIKLPKHITVAIFPPIPYIPFFRTSAGKIPSYGLGVQSISTTAEGAHTGEIALSMLTHEPIGYVLVGHSECRLKGETNQDTNAKILAILKAKLRPVLCVGERERDDSPEYLAFIARQITEALLGVPKAKLKEIIIAYEPVWAIGSHAKRSATPIECLEMVVFIRRILCDSFGRSVGDAISIVYGGSVDDTNAAAFVSEGGVDGFLLGRASLVPKTFAKIVTQVATQVIGKK